MMFFHCMWFLAFLIKCVATERLSVLIEQNKQTITEITEKYSEAKLNVMRAEATLVDSTKNILVATEQIKLAIAEELLWDRFYEGYKKQTVAAETFRLIDSFVAGTIDGGLQKVGSQGNVVFVDCFNKELSTILKTIIDALPQKLVKLNDDEVAFRNQLQMCSIQSVIKTGKGTACIDLLLKNYPYPVVAATGMQTVNLMGKLTKCVASGAEDVRKLGSVSVSVYRKQFPGYQQLIIPEFESNHTPPIVFPTFEKLSNISDDIETKLDTVKAKVVLATYLQKQAAEAKSLNFESAMQFLKPQIQHLEDFINETQTSATPAELSCYIPVKDFLIVAIRNRSTYLVNYIGSSGQLPSPISITNAEQTAKDIEAKTKVFWAAVDCSKQLRNLFHPDHMDKCLGFAKQDTLGKLHTIQLQLEDIAEEASNVLDLVAHAKSNAETELRKEARSVFYAHLKCIAGVSKIKIEIQQQPCATETVK